ncbi:MAG: sulfotransferase family protein [Acidimicrobiia bacterium]
MAMRPSDPTWAWVLGTGRCGSTLVHEVLARHPDVGFMSNLEDRLPLAGWTSRFSPACYRWVPERFTTKGRLRFAPSEGYRLLDRAVSPALSTPCRDLGAADADPWLAGRLRGLFEARATAQGRPVFLHKFTGWPRAGLLEAVFPGSRFVHVVRDGRAVAASWLQMGWWLGHRGPEGWPWGPLPPDYQDEYEASGRNFAVLAGIAWKLLLDAFEVARHDLGGRWLDVRYEDVVADPRACFADIAGFLGLAWDGRFERAVARYEFRTGAVDAYRRHLDPTTLDLLDTSLAGHLERWGYAAMARR